MGEKPGIELYSDVLHRDDRWARKETECLLWGGPGGQPGPCHSRLLTRGSKKKRLVEYGPANHQSLSSPSNRDTRSARPEGIARKASVLQSAGVNRLDKMLPANTPGEQKKD